MKSVLNIHWKDWCWSSNILGTWCEELTHQKRPWCWERLRAGGEGGHRGWDGWMASLTRWTWVWVDSGSWWWTGKPGVLQSMESQRVRHNWATELNWTDMSSFSSFLSKKVWRRIQTVWCLWGEWRGQNWKIISCPPALYLGLLDLCTTGGDALFSEGGSSWGEYWFWPQLSLSQKSFHVWKKWYSW